jgi:DNA topoisomerase-1
VDYEFTAKCEALFDQVVEGKKNFAQLVPAFDKRLGEWIAQVEGQFPDKLKDGTVEIGTWQEHLVTAGKGKYGTYVKYQDLYCSVKDKEPNQVTLAEAIAYLEAKQKSVQEGDKALVAQVGKQYQIKNGQYGLYLTDGKTNASLPKSVSLEEARQWSIQQCKDHLKSYKEWKKSRQQTKK